MHVLIRMLSLLALLLLPGCQSESVNDYRQDAAAFCELFKYEHWQAYANKPGSVDLKKALDARIDKAIKTKKFKQITTELDEVRFLRQLYPTAQQKISALTGEAWDCPDYQRFYGISYEIESDPTSSNDSLLESLKKDFVQQITGGSRDFTVSDVVDKADDKKAFLKKSLDGLYTPGAEAISYKEIFIRQVKQTGHFHLGLIKLDYTNPEKARAAFDKMSRTKSRYFRNTKILTKYRLLLKTNSVLVLYSETSIDLKVGYYLDNSACSGC